MRREENQLGATECFIALIICSTCFGHSYAHHQELETIIVLLPHMVCNGLVAGGRRSGAGPCTWPLTTWRWTYKCPKHVDQINGAIKHSVASSWFSSLCLFRRLSTGYKWGSGNICLWMGAKCNSPIYEQITTEFFNMYQQKKNTSMSLNCQYQHMHNFNVTG